MRKPTTMRGLEDLGRVRLSPNFFFRDFLHSEIASLYGIPNIPDDPDLAIAAGRKLCEELLEPLWDRFGRISIRSAYRSPAVNDFGNRNNLNCSQNEKNFAGHIWDRRDAEGRMGATASIVVHAFLPYYERTGHWEAIAWWVHDHLPYADMEFFPKLAAFNLQWKEGVPTRRIYSFIPPRRGLLTKPGMGNWAGSHEGEYAEWVVASSIAALRHPTHRPPAGPPSPSRGGMVREPRHLSRHSLPLVGRGDHAKRGGWGRGAPNSNVAPRTPLPTTAGLVTNRAMTTHRFLPIVWHNVLGTVPPALRIASGDTVITETLDAAGFDKDGVERAHGPNPMNGPIYIEGAQPGDALKVEIIRMTPNRATGWTRSSLSANVVEPETARDLPSREKATWSIDRQGGTLQLQDAPKGLENFVLPLEPMIGCFGVAPKLGQAFSTATSAENGGNMDYRGFGPGATVWFPVAVEGALFFVGDCHAVQGDGEIVGTGVETSYEVELRLTVESHRALTWPRGENADDIFSVGNARPLDQALQHATNDMFNWLMTDYGLSRTAASHLMGQVVRYDVGNVYDPAYTMVCRIAKKWLPPRS